MGKTVLEIRGEDFLINGRKVYSEIEGSKPEAHGLLMNARFIQGIFDDKADRERYNRFGKEFDPERNTNELIAALPEWYEYGLRAFTVGFQGGGPCFTMDPGGIASIDNNPFGPNGLSLDPAYAARMDRLIRAADELGMVVIVSYLYVGQLPRLKGGKAVLNAVRTASRFLREGGYTNVIIEVANEHNIQAHGHPLVYTPEGVVALLEIARAESGGMPVGCSGTGDFISEEVCRESDVILIHGNEISRQVYYNHINQVKRWAPGKPVVCNEDSQALANLQVAYQTRTSWGYYNNMTKQEPPSDWGITPGEDLFFAYRMAEGIGISLPPIPEEDQYYLQGLEPDMEVEGKRWIRLASLYPEKIDYVRFFRNGEEVFTSYVDPFSVNFRFNWYQDAWRASPEDREWKAVIHLKNGEEIVKFAI
ncbi:hypothetical protein [Cohnella thailandensis]|uniref:Glycoside hydrolase family 5 domain-containing protein n=1 Tax=Cohnella thailandensis TaxID=557557 RepID=A0A841T193_9BACL|nr:hypothetical protein [Cohnella thailandensis]MBB6637312.1 hypothetical protein [Cohnella thailandensis]MBP1976640.1 hypothetical protein [Cohnella thailandensis]